MAAGLLGQQVQAPGEFGQQPGGRGVAGDLLASGPHGAGTSLDPMDLPQEDLQQDDRNDVSRRCPPRHDGGRC